MELELACLSSWNTLDFAQHYEAFSTSWALELLAYQAVLSSFLCLLLPGLIFLMEDLPLLQERRLLALASNVYV
ncbi:hypothetical protein CPB83DRAFT_582251 [Crepidotus variabilis]|uniref:Uncharacterized protein n=1 Tax=Crepidotus variabilis TaxID=179855 RepID=A0A9P6JT73_9AGAR|nr:hypothetical protein CPB83DRAFT_582251 [Crepidotus variabilis]